MGNTSIDYSSMKIARKENVKAYNQYKLNFNEWLDARGISEKEFEQNLEQIKANSFNRGMDLNEQLNKRYSRGYPFKSG